MYIDSLCVHFIYNDGFCPQSPEVSDPITNNIIMNMMIFVRKIWYTVWGVYIYFCVCEILLDDFVFDFLHVYCSGCVLWWTKFTFGVWYRTDSFIINIWANNKTMVITRQIPPFPTGICNNTIIILKLYLVCTLIYL